MSSGELEALSLAADTVCFVKRVSTPFLAPPLSSTTSSGGARVSGGGGEGGGQGLILFLVPQEGVVDNGKGGWAAGLEGVDSMREEGGEEEGQRRDGRGRREAGRRERGGRRAREAARARKLERERGVCVRTYLIEHPDDTRHTPHDTPYTHTTSTATAESSDGGRGVGAKTPNPTKGEFLFIFCFVYVSLPEYCSIFGGVETCFLLMLQIKQKSVYQTKGCTRGRNRTAKKFLRRYMYLHPHVYVHNISICSYNHIHVSV